MKKTLLSILLFTLLLFLFEGCPIDPVKSTKDLFIFQQSPVNKTLNAVSFIDPAKGVAVGVSGTIITTKNGGYSWNRVGGLDFRDLYAVAMIDKSLIVAAGDTGKIERSTDGGASWALVPSSNIQFLKTIRGIAFHSVTDGYAVGDSCAVLFTSDAGVTWTKQNSPETNQILYGVSFNSAGKPYAVGSNGNILTDSSGTWIIDTTIGSNDFYSIQFVSHGSPFAYSDTGYAVGDSGVIIKTINGGNSWNQISSPTTNSLRSVFLTNYHWGYAVGDGGTVLRYDGRSWELISPPGVNNRLNGVDPWTPTSICVGEDGTIVDINPPAVTDGSALDIQSPSNCQWEFTLTAGTLEDSDPKGGESFQYNPFEVCSSVEQLVSSGVPLTGWAQNEKFFSKSAHIDAGQTYAPDDPNHPLDPLSLDMSSGSVSCYLTCYYLDQYGNPHLIKSFFIECP